MRGPPDEKQSPLLATAGGSTNKRGGALLSVLSIPQTGCLYKPQFSEHAPSDAHDLDALLDQVRDRYFLLYTAGELAEAEDAARTYRVLFARRHQEPTPATLPAALPDKETWTAYQARRDRIRYEADREQREAEAERDRQAAARIQIRIAALEGVP